MYFVLVESTIHANLEIKNRNNTYIAYELKNKKGEKIIRHIVRRSFIRMWH